jgi:hypothetical protein
MNFGNIVIGLIFVGLGVLTLKFNQGFSNSLGTPSFVAKYFGPGREYSFYKLVSILLMFIGGLFIFGLWGPLMDFLFAPLRGLVRKA